MEALIQEQDLMHDTALEMYEDSMKGIMIQEIAFIGVKPWWTEIVGQQVTLQNYLGLSDVYIFNAPSCGEKLVRAFKSSLVQNITTVFGYQDGSLYTQTLYVEFTYSKGGDIIAIINNTPAFHYFRMVSGSMESYQILSVDLKGEIPRFQDFQYNGFHLSKFCKFCRFFSSEPSVDLENDVIHYQFIYNCDCFKQLREDIP